MALICIGFAIGLRNDPSKLPSALIDRPLPEFNLEPVRDEDIGFSDEHVKNQVALINVFASWCTPCLVEHPTFVRLSKQDRIPIYGVNWKDKRVDGLQWLQRYGDPYVRVGSDPNSEVGIEFGVTGAPETFVIDRSGRIRYKQIGPITEDVWRNTIEPIVLSLENEAQ
jgi:cytochrome c biogenesis protein CcmG/thiol:disulfide interchange protein DsbE